VSAAVELAKAGKSVVLVERRIYLGREVTSEYRPWFDAGNSSSDLPEILQACIDKNIEQPDGSRKRLLLDHVKKALEDLLFEHGVEILYTSNVVQLIAEGKKQSSESNEATVIY